MWNFSIICLNRNILIFRHPERTKNDGLLFLEPFTDDVWMLVIAFSVVSTILLWLFAIFEQNLHQFPLNENITTIRVNQISLDESKWHLNSKSKSSSDSDSYRLKCIVIINKLLKRCKYGTMLLCGRGYHVFDNQYQTITLLFESLLFYTGLICQQG